MLSFSVCARATTLTFEDLPDAYFFNAGDQNIGGYYPGISFGPDVTGLSVSRFGGYDSAAFPPHSGDVPIWDAPDSTITITFSSPESFFSVWYTSFDPLTLQAFGAGSSLLGTVVGNPNTDGTTGTSSLLTLSAPGIKSIELTSSAGLFVLDDVTFQSVPEPASMLLSGSVLLFLTFRFARTNSGRTQ